MFKKKGVRSQVVATARIGRRTEKDDRKTEEAEYSKEKEAEDDLDVAAERSDTA